MTAAVEDGAARECGDERASVVAARNGATSGRGREKSEAATTASKVGGHRRWRRARAADGELGGRGDGAEARIWRWLESEDLVVAPVGGAAQDIEELAAGAPFALGFERRARAPSRELSFKLFRPREPIPHTARH